MSDEITGQLQMFEVAEMDRAAAEQQHQDFVDKFKPKLTTDDCYTPALVYDAVADWVAGEYGLNRADFVRPFWPGADYQAAEYPEGCIVVDNPPFSIVTKITRWYHVRGIRFFLFAPALTLFSGKTDGICYLPTGVQITYANGAQVPTSFVTNLEAALVRVVPELMDAVERADTENLKAGKVSLPKYAYPDEVITAAFCQWLCHHHTPFCVMPKDAIHIRAMDAQRAAGKAIFGSGFLLSERAAAERAAAKRWTLSDRERRIVSSLGGAEAI